MSRSVIPRRGIVANIAAILLPLLGGCAADLPSKDSHKPVGFDNSSTVHSGLTDKEQEAYDRESDRLRTKAPYHEIVLNPNALIDKLNGHTLFGSLNVPAPVYLLGIEKPKNAQAVPPHRCETTYFSLEDLRRASSEGYKAACNVLDDPHMQVLTHIVKFDGINKGVYQRPCFLYNVYYPTLSCAGVPLSPPVEGSDLFLDGVQAIDSLRADLQRNLDGITHIVVLSTGWNTHQDESLFNYLEWANVLGSQAPINPHFHPLYLGFSWQSQWDFGSLFKLLHKISVANKGNDADEVGLRWAGRLINDVVMPLASARGIPVVLVGHSYGTRVLGTAVYRRDIERDASATSPSPLAFLALEPAFTLNRFDKGKEATFATMVEPTTLVMMTGSRHDQAGTIASALFTPFALSERGIRKVAAGKFPKVTPGDVTSEGHIDNAPPGHRLYLLDASRVVSNHSDVYNTNIGTLFWDMMKMASAQ